MNISLSELVVEKNNWEKGNLDKSVEFCVRGEDFDGGEIFIPRYGRAPEDMGPTFGKRFDEGDVLYMTRNPQLRKAAVADRSGYCGEKVIVAGSTGYPGFDYRLLPFVFQSESFIEHTVKNTIGSTNKHIRWKDVVGFEFELIEGKRQKNAANILLKYQDSYVSLIDAISSAKNLYQDIVDAELGAIIETAASGKKRNIIPLSELFLINPRVQVHDDVIPYVDMASLGTELPAIKYSGEEKPKKSSGSKFQNHDVLLARITPCFENGKASYVDFLEDDQVAVGSTEFIVIRANPKYEIVPKLGYYVVKTKKFRHYALHHMEGTSGRQRVTPRIFDELYMNLDKFNGLERLVNKLHSLELVLKTLLEKKEKSTHFRQSLIFELLGI
jgi:type I restriction enzyme S subunit